MDVLRRPATLKRKTGELGNWGNWLTGKLDEGRGSFFPFLYLGNPPPPPTHPPFFLLPARPPVPRGLRYTPLLPHEDVKSSTATRPLLLPLRLRLGSRGSGLQAPGSRLESQSRLFVAVAYFDVDFGVNGIL